MWKEVYFPMQTEHTQTNPCMVILKQTGEKPFICNKCDKAFNEKGNLVAHYNTHTDNRPFKCSFDGCSMAFKIISHLTGHMRYHLNHR